MNNFPIIPTALLYFLFFSFLKNRMIYMMVRGYVQNFLPIYLPDEL